MRYVQIIAWVIQLIFKERQIMSDAEKTESPQLQTVLTAIDKPVASLHPVDTVKLQALLKLQGFDVADGEWVHMLGLAQTAK